jgi:multisubunit Na+/H+ antiporter MnhE subunit
MIIKDGHWLEYGIIVWLQFEAEHFLLGFAVGVLVFWLTSTILSKWFSIQVTDRFIFIVLLLLSLSASVAVHILEDFALNWF